MKKLFAIVLVFAMALAIAVPAMASGWDPITVPDDPATAISFKLYGLETEENTAVLGGLYEELTATYPLVKGTSVHFMVVVTIPAKAKLSSANVKLLEERRLDLSVTADYIDITKAYVYVGDSMTYADQSAKIVDNEYTDDLGTENYGTTIKYEFWGNGVTGGKDATVKAKLGYYNEWELKDTYYEFEAMNAAGKVPFTAYTNALTKTGATSFTIKDVDADSVGNSIIFPVSKGYIDATKVITLTVTTSTITSYNGTYEVNRNVNSDLTFKDQSDVVWGPSDTTGQYAAVKAIFDNFFKMLGFEYAGANAMTAEHFELYFGTIDEVTETLVYPAGYVTVTNPTVEPPQTGDATTVVGFVMIAIALIAAAAVTVKKVRA